MIGTVVLSTGLAFTGVSLVLGAIARRPYGARSVSSA
jgi:hypothetical protein